MLIDKMLELSLITSLKILFMWAAMKEGMIFFLLRRLIDWMISHLPVKVFMLLRKPCYECLFCMSSIWGIVFTFNIAAFTLSYLGFLMSVGGINYLIQWLVKEEE